MNYRRVFIQNSYLFLTIITNNRLPLLIKNISFLKESIESVKQIYDFEVFAYVVLPEHIHCIVKPSNILDYPKIVKSFKYSFTKIVGLVKPTYPKIKYWQNRYWEHTILTEDDLYKHLDYIHYNPMKHYNIAPKDWRYSSFKKFVKLKYYEENWCNLQNKYDINSMNLE